MKKIKFIFLICITLFCLTGCFEKKEVEDLAYVIALGIDKGKENKISLTFQVAVPIKIAGEGSDGGGKESNSLITLETNTLTNAISRADAMISKEITLSHNKIVVVSDEFAKGGIEDVLSELITNPEVRPKTSIIIHKGSAKEFLSNLEPILEKNPARYYDLLLASDEYTGYSVDNDIFKFYLAAKDDFSTPYALLTESIEDSNSQATQNSLIKTSTSNNELVKETSRDVSSSSSQDNSGDTSSSSSQDNSGDTSSSGSQDNSGDTSSSGSQDNSGDTSNSNNQNSSKSSQDSASGDSQQQSSGDTQQDSSSGNQQQSSGDNKQQSSDNSQQESSGDSTSSNQESSNNSSNGNDNESIPQTANAAGIALFREGKLIGEIRDEEIISQVILQGHLKKVNIDVEDIKDKSKYTVVKIFQTDKPKIKVKLENNIPQIDIDVKINAELIISGSPIDYSDGNNKDLLAKNVKDKILKDLNSYINKTSKELKVDPIGFGKIYKTSLLTLDDIKKISWKDVYPNSKFNIKLDLHLDTTQMVSNEAS